MKLLDNIRFEALSNALSIDNGECNIEGRLESYSCKMAGSEKKLFKSLNEGRRPNELQALSPPNDSAFLNGSPLNTSSGSDTESPLCDTISTRVLFNLISTLNASFPDYDFSDAKSCEFKKESHQKLASRSPLINMADNPLVASHSCLNFVTRLISQAVVSCVDTQLPGYSNELKQQLWSTIDNEISLKHCLVYRSQDTEVYISEGETFELEYD